MKSSTVEPGAFGEMKLWLNKAEKRAWKLGYKRVISLLCVMKLIQRDEDAQRLEAGKDLMRLEALPSVRNDEKAMELIQHCKWMLELVGVTLIWLGSWSIMWIEFRPGDNQEFVRRRPSARVVVKGVGQAGRMGVAGS